MGAKARLGAVAAAFVIVMLVLSIAASAGLVGMLTYATAELSTTGSGVVAVFTPGQRGVRLVGVALRPALSYLWSCDGRPLPAGATSLAPPRH